MRGVQFLSVALAVGLFMPACGGGGGSGAQQILSLQSIFVLSQPAGPLSPFGTTAGGDEVQLTGTAFVAGITVRFGTEPAVVRQVSSRQVIVVSPPGAEGFAGVTVTSPSGSRASLDNVFRYVTPPTLLAVEALTGPTAGEPRAPIEGGETLRIHGENLRSGLTVEIGGIPAAASLVDAATATVTVPPVASEQVVDVTLTNPSGLESTLVRGLAYTQEFSLARASDTLPDARAAHLFRRAAFGALPARIQKARKDGLNATVDQLLTFVNDTAVEDEALKLYGPSVPPADNLNTRVNKEWWIHLLLNNPNPLQERLAWFLNDHFATSEEGFPDDFLWTMHFQANLFRRFSLARTDRLANDDPGLGYNWRELLVRIAKDRAMLHWLDGRVSRVGNPNENFAREFWELFTLGEGNGYREADIQEAARAFTGFFWYRDRTDPADLEIQRVAYRPGRHDATQKTILGATGFFGYDSISPFFEAAAGPPPAKDPSVETDVRDTDGGVVGLTLRQRPVEASRFICRKLWEFFVYAEPPDAVIDELAKQLRAPGANQWSLEPVLERMLKSKAMYSSRAMKGVVKGPVDFVIGFLRATGIRLHRLPATNAARVRVALQGMDQVVLDPPDVNGWPSGLSWMSSQTMLARYNFLAAAVKELDDFADDIEPLLPPGNPRPTPTQLVDHLAGILDVQLSGNARTRYIEYVDSAWSGGQKVPFGYDRDNPDHVKLKTRGLIWMIAQYHDAHRN